MSKFLFPPGHKYSLGNKGGAPPKYKTVDELDDRIAKWKEWLQGESGVRLLKKFDKYTGKFVQVYEECEETGEKVPIWEEYWIEKPQNPTIASLVLFLGFANRASILDYQYRQGRTSKFASSIQSAIEWIGQPHQENLMEGGSGGSQFWLNNHGWKNQSSVEVDTTNENKNTTMSFEQAMFAKYGKDWKKTSGYDDGSTEGVPGE